MGGTFEKCQEATLAPGTSRAFALAMSDEINAARVGGHRVC
jgi:hypothetical protein